MRAILVRRVQKAGVVIPLCLLNLGRAGGISLISRCSARYLVSTVAIERRGRLLATVDYLDSQDFPPLVPAVVLAVSPHFLLLVVNLTYYSVIPAGSDLCRGPNG